MKAPFHFADMANFPKLPDVFPGFTKLVDVLFNGRPAAEPSGVTIEKLVARGTSVVRVGSKFYRVTCKEVEVTR
jgi:hypothetical protein